MPDIDMELLLSVVKGLGSVLTDYNGNKVYSKDDDCLPCLKDLQRLLRQDESETREAFQVLSQYNIAKSDLVPIIVTYPKETEVVYNALKVLTYLTMPIDPASDNKAMQAENMQLVKEAFMEKDAMAVIVGLVAEPLGRHPRMTEADGLIVQLVITFIRNLLAIPDRAATAGSAGDHRTRLRQELITRMFDDNIMELLLVIAQHAHAKPFKTEAPLLMEIFQQVFAGTNAAELAKAIAPAVVQRQPGQSRRAPVVRPKGSGMASERAAMERHQARLKQSSSGPPARHARFGGLFVRRYHAEDRGAVVRSNPLVPNLPAIPELKRSNKALVEEKPLAQLQSQLLWKLRQYMEQLLQAGSLGTVMAAVLQDLKAGLHISRLSRDDFVCFFRLAQLATAFVRIQQENTLKQQQDAKQKRQPPGEDAVTASSAQAAATGAADAAVQENVDKAAPSSLNRAAANSPADNKPEAETGANGAEQGAEGGKQAEGSPFACVSAILGWDTFHMVHVLWIGLVDLPGKAPEKDWELQHESLALLKEMLYALDLALYVGTSADKKAADRLQRRLLHDDMKESGLLPVVGRLLKSFNYAFQPRSHAVDLVQALHVILRMLDRLNTSEAGGFLVKQKARAGGGRRKKPQPFAEGSPEGADAAAGVEGAEASPSPEPSPGGIQGGRAGDPFEEAEQEEAEEERRRRVREVAYDLQRRVKQELAFPAVIHFYCWLLQGFATNGSTVNHCLVAFLKRIANPAGLNLEPMLYQLSVLRVLQAILSDKAFRKQEGAGEVVHLATHVTRNLFARLAPDTATADDGDDEMYEASEEEGEGESEEAARRREARQRLRKEAKVRQKSAAMMFIELMFWKNAMVAETVRDEYNWRDIYDKQTGKKGGADSDADSDGGQIGFASHRPKKGVMSEKQANVLKEIFEEVNGLKDCLQRCVTGMDGAFKKSHISRQLKAMGLRRNRLTDSQEERLRALYDKHHEDKGYLAIIAEDMSGGFSKGQISSQLRKLGLKKRLGKQKSSKRGSSSGSGSDSASGSAASHSDSVDDSDSDAANDDKTGSGDEGGVDTTTSSPRKAATDGKQSHKTKSKKARKEKLKKQGKKSNPHSGIRDWSSDNSSDAEPAPKPNGPSASAHGAGSDTDDRSDGGKADADDKSEAGKEDAADKAEGSKEYDAQLEADTAHHSRSTDDSKAQQKWRKRLSSSKGDKQRKLSKKQAAPKQTSKADWSSDESDAEPEPLQAMPQSDSDTQAPEPVAARDSKSKRASGNKQKATSGTGHASPDRHHSVRREADAFASDSRQQQQQQQAPLEEQAQHAKRRGRLRKARASSEQPQSQPAAAGPEADDIMVDLEDDIADVDSWQQSRLDANNAAAGSPAERILSESRDDADAKHQPSDQPKEAVADSRRKMKDSKRKSGPVAETADGKRLAGSDECRQQGDNAENEEPSKPLKRLKKQVDIPDAARNALEALKAKRLQNAQQSSAPLEDTLPSSSGPIDHNSPSHQIQDRPLSAERDITGMQMEAQADPVPVTDTLDQSGDHALRNRTVQSDAASMDDTVRIATEADLMPMTDTVGPSEGHALSDSNARADAAPVNDTLHMEAQADPMPMTDTLDQSCDHACSGSNTQADAAPTDDTLPGSEPAMRKAATAAAIKHDDSLMIQSQSSRMAAPVTDTVAAYTKDSMSRSRQGQDANDGAADEDDDVFIREAMASAEQAGGTSNSNQDNINDGDDDALLQSLLAEGE